MPTYNELGLSDTYLASIGAPIKPPETGVLSRLAYHFGTAVPEAVEGVSTSIGNIGGFDGRFIPPEAKLDPATSGLGKVADFAGALMPVAVEMGVTGAALRPILGATGLLEKAPLVSRMVTDAAGLGLLGAEASAGLGAEQAVEGGIFGALTKLPRMKRILPAAALALASKGIIDTLHPEPVIGDITMGDINAVTGFATAFLPGQFPVKAPLPNNFAPSANPAAAGLVAPQGNAMGAGAVAPVNMTPFVPPIGAPQGNMMGAGALNVPPPRTVTPGVVTAGQGMGAMPANLAVTAARTQANTPPPVSTPLHPESDFNPQYGKLHDLPEYRRTEGGGVPADIMQTVGLDALRGALGAGFTGTAAALDDNADTDPTTLAVLGGLVAAFGPAAGRKLIEVAERKFSNRSIQGSVPAGGGGEFKLVKGLPWNSTEDLLVAAKRGKVRPTDVTVSQDKIDEIARKHTGRSVIESGPEGIDSAAYHYEVGKLYGYSDDDIAAFLVNRKSIIDQRRAVGQSNITATIKKNMDDAMMMNQNDPKKAAEFLDKYAIALRAKGNLEGAANFEAASAELKKNFLSKSPISLGGPFVTAFERAGLEDSLTERVLKLGSRDVSKSGLMNVNAFAKAISANKAELNAYYQHYPEAFSGTGDFADIVDTNKLRKLMKETPLLAVKELLVETDAPASVFETKMAGLQHAVDTAGWRMEHDIESGNFKFWNREGEPNSPAGENTRIQAALDDFREAERRGFVRTIDEAREARTATVRYDGYGVNPLSIDELKAKGAMDIIVQLNPQINTGDKFHISPHWAQGTGDSLNQLGWARMYFEKQGTKLIAHVFEFQSDWYKALLKQRTRDKKIAQLFAQEKELEARGLSTDGIRAQIFQHAEGDEGRTFIVPHPLLEEWEPIVLRAAIKAAKKKGATHIALSDSKTAMMTEQHDIQALDHPPVVFEQDIIDPNTPPNDYNRIKTGKWILSHTEDFPGASKYDIRTLAEQDDAYPFYKIFDTKAEADAAMNTVTFTIPQQKGMEEAYDIRGPALLRRITGSVPENVNLGTHKNALGGGEKGEAIIGSPVFTEGGKNKSSITARAFSLEKIKGEPPLAGFALRAKGEAGLVIPELNAALARGFVGGLVGGIAGGTFDDPDTRSGFVTGGLIGVAAGMLGPSVARALNNSMSKVKVIPPTGAPSKARSWMNLVKNFEIRMEDMAGNAINGSMLAGDRFARVLDHAFQLTMPTAMKRALLESRGIASHLLGEVDEAMIAMSLRYKPDQAVMDLTNKYLDGTITQADYLRQLPQNEPQNLLYGQLAATARTTINGLQRMVAEGIGDPKLQKIILDSLDSYITRSFKLFSHDQWMPDEKSTQALVAHIHTSNLWKGAAPEDIRRALMQYVREVKQTKGIYKGAAFGGGYDQAINQAVLQPRINMNKEWREFLGEVTDPAERIYQTIFRLRPMAEASRYFTNVINRVDDEGMPHFFRSYADRDAFESQLLHRMQNVAPDSKEGLSIQLQLSRMKGFQLVEKIPKFGDLGGGIVSRHVWDTLKTYDSISKVSSSPWLRSIVGLHTAIKLNRTAFNPLLILRNMATVPMFMLIARVDPSDMVEAWHIIKDNKHAMRKEILVQGIGSVDQIKGEFFKEWETVTGGQFNFGNLDLANLGLGKYDLAVAEKFVQRGLRKWLDFYRVPDNMVRIGAYLSAKRRFSEMLKKGIDDPEVIARATDFTNRYTMNYDAIAPFIKTLRQVPFFNLFLSYTAEMARIGKNLLEDVTLGSDKLVGHDRMWAMIPLSTLVVLPEIAQSASESLLSPSEKTEWDRLVKLMPDYARTRYRWGMHKDKNGSWRFMDVTPMFAADSFNQMAKAIATGDWKAAAEVNPLFGFQNTPVMNIAAEQITGRDLRTHREFRGGADRVAAFAKEIVPPWVPSVGHEAQRFRQAYTVTDEGTLGATNLKTGLTLTPADFWATYFRFGIKSGSYNLNILEKKAENEAKQQVANELAYYNDVQKSNANQEMKDEAARRASLAIANIREHYMARMGLTPTNK